MGIQTSFEDTAAAGRNDAYKHQNICTHSTDYEFANLL